MHLNSVCVYCGSSNRVNSRYKNLAREVGTLLGKQGLRVVYGGGRVGLMGLVADSALAVGARVIGIIPEHIRAIEVQHNDLTELHVVDTMHERKRRMSELSDAFVILPGGFGTLDETFEIITWKQLGLHRKPIILVNYDGYWDSFLTLVDQMITAGFVMDSNRTLFTCVTSVDDLQKALLSPQDAVLDDPAKKWM